MALTVSMVGEDSTDGTATSVKMSDGGALHSSPRMTEVFTTISLPDGTAVTKPMLGGPMPCTVFINPAAGDTVTLSYVTNGVTVVRGTYTTYTEERMETAVDSIVAQRTAGSGTTSAVWVQ